MDWLNAINYPALAFALTLALLMGAFFHALRGGGGWRLALHFLLSAAGFGVGQIVGAWTGYALYPFGVLDLGAGAIGSLIVLIVGDWLSRVNPPDKSGEV
ncbi:MAG: hypothetical protein LC099_02835 [Anaerolineales bacterium]|nr:hypothetical protein [Anaerolineales bacterium]